MSWYVSGSNRKFVVKESETGDIVAEVYNEKYLSKVAMAEEMYKLLKALEPRAGVIEITGLLAIIDGEDE